MSQHDFNIANQSFPATRTDLNNALVALASNSSGDAEPSTTYANQWWYETDSNILKFRNEANNAWIPIAVLDQSANNVLSITTQGLTIGATALTATGAELNKLSGATISTTELNILDGVTATTAEINLIDGGTARGTTALADGDGILINDAGTMRMTNVQTVKTYMSGASASDFPAKAFVNFNGTGTIAIRDSANVASLTDQGTGKYSVTLTNNMSDANYTSLGSGAGSSANDTRSVMTNRGVDNSVSSFKVQVKDANGNSTDADYVGIALHGTLA